MVDEKKLEGMFRNLQAALEQLDEISRFGKEEFLKNGAVLGGAKYYLQTAIETCINIGNHIIASEGFRAPRDYRDIFTVLQENGVLTEEIVVRLRQMAGLRNRLVHLYWEVEDERIYHFLRENLGDFDIFTGQITQFVRGLTS